MHFSLYVIHNTEEDIDDILSPFCESNEFEFEFDYFSDDCIPADEITQEDAAAEGMELDPTGEFYGYYNNPKARYDWYEIGGRLEDIIPHKDDRRKPTSRQLLMFVDIDSISPPAAFITPDGEWIDMGMMILQPYTDDQARAFRDYLRTLNGSLAITAVDCHI